MMVSMCSGISYAETKIESQVIDSLEGIRVFSVIVKDTEKVLGNGTVEAYGYSILHNKHFLSTKWVTKVDNIKWIPEISKHIHKTKE